MSVLLLLYVIGEVRFGEIDAAHGRGAVERIERVRAGALARRRARGHRHRADQRGGGEGRGPAIPGHAGLLADPLSSALAAELAPGALRAAASRA